MIPKFSGYYPSEGEMDSKQRKFYRHVEESLSKGKYINIEGNIGYIFVYLYKLLRKWKSKGFENLSEYLIYISELYSHESKLSWYCQFWAHDCLLGLKRYEEYLEKTEPVQVTGTYGASNLRLNIQRYLTLPANPIDILLLAGGRKTNFIVNNQALYKDKILECFNKYAEDNQGWFSIFDQWIPEKKLIPHQLFSGAPLCENPELSFKIIAYYSPYDKIDDVIRPLSKDAENLAREEAGVPKIGQGWISETELFRKLENEFSTTKIIQHGQPSWLGQQHFDVWFPNWNIAIEYHGKQHFEPVDFFGGEEAFQKTVYRDKRKANLAKRHGVKLFIITENDDSDELIQNIYDIRDRHRILLPKV